MKGAASIFAGFLVACAMTAQARTEVTVMLKPDAAAKITVGSCFDTLSMAGYVPIDVTINNSSGQTRQWTLQFTGPQGYFGMNGGNTLKSTFTVSAENNGTRTIALLVPTNLGGNGQMPMDLMVTGYGAESGIEESLGGRPSSGKSGTPFAVISESLGTSIWSELTKRIDNDGADLLGSTVNPDDLPEDWRGLSGVSGLWLKGDELARLSAAQRSAILTWVHTGGWLMLYGTAQPPADFLSTGFGQVRCVPDTVINLDETELTITRHLPEHRDQSELAALPRTTELTEVRPNVPLLFGFMGLFATVVGPVNIFVLARRRRERLFWSTPLISLVASALLMGMIVMQDGLGGHGIRTAAVCVFPDSHTEVVMQEQLSRSGLLLGSAFQTADPVNMWQLDLSTPVSDSPQRELVNEGTSFSGGWFSSRAAQGQRLVAVTPTRAEITLTNASDARDKGAAPAIVSSFPGTLDALVYTDNQNREWLGRNVQTGQKQTLQPLNQAEDPTRDAVLDLPNNAIRKLAATQGYFRAESADGPEEVATLPAIHWTSKGITYVGPVTATP